MTEEDNDEASELLTEYRGGPGNRQTGKTTRIARELQSGKPGCVYFAPHSMMMLAVPRLLGETPRFTLCLPTQIGTLRGMVPPIVAVDCYDILKSEELDAIKKWCVGSQTSKLVMIHSGKSDEEHQT